MFFPFFKLYIWYQIAQRITYVSIWSLLFFKKSQCETVCLRGYVDCLKTKKLFHLAVICVADDLTILSSTYNSYTVTLSLIKLRILLQQGFRSKKLWWTLKHVANSFKMTEMTYYSRALLAGQKVSVTPLIEITKKYTTT